MTVKIWDASSHKVISTIFGKHQKAVSQALMFNSTTLITCSDGGNIMFWDVNSLMQEPVHIFHNTLKFQKFVSFMSIMKDGTLVTACSEGRVKFWKEKVEQNPG